MKILVTGAAGFIGSHTSRKLLERGDEVVGIDNFNDYYDPSLKEARLKWILSDYPDFRMIRMDIVDRDAMAKLFKEEKFDRVINLAAQAGVRHSLEDPHSYVDSNVTGFLNVLEGCRYNDVEHLVYASTSSVYGSHTKMPFSEHDAVDHPLAIYAATKKANELMAHSYSHLFRLPTSGLRFFTVYGPWGRPDMALYKFTKAILSGDPIDVFNFGNHKRDFTYVEDIVGGVVAVCDKPASENPDWVAESPDPATSNAPYRIYNIGNNQPVDLLEYIEVIEDCLGCKAAKNMLPIQSGDVPDTYSDSSLLAQHVGYRSGTTVKQGVRLFIEWYQWYYG